jgi:peptidoglycan/xylan/chitin deacetylase (PgdA/CDA1 family)
MRNAFQPVVLCYHAVSNTWPHQLAVSPEVFEQQLASLIRRGFRPVSAERTMSGRGKVFHVTFDDAYASVAGVVPTLAKLGVPATVFVCSDFAETGRPLDIPELAAEARVHPHELRTMNWDQVLDLVEGGVEIGSHTLSHAHLTQLGDDELGRELRESRERIETQLGRSCRFVAYPYGDDDGRVHRAARDAGYEAGFALPGRLSPLNVHALPRVGLYGKDGVLRATVKTTPIGRRAIEARSRMRGRRVQEPEPSGYLSAAPMSVSGV